MKTLELRFENEMGKVSTLSITEPSEPVDPLLVSAAMDEIIANSVFTSPGGDFVKKVDARIVERKVEQIEVN
ncbi:DUF2922 domain-containing protein [Aciduricibacillus chroicocephali]|uniref:DUF2922 domain-containing protein n=1 Tax=Aciduricibacillus chroicocephali TaxID=3054939 RepID=A0ABY9KUC7_9BACI|nr:DUF2922 domain-containing protein [Bacillaceae bacterium 44XB]